MQVATQGQKHLTSRLQKWARRERGRETYSPTPLLLKWDRGMQGGGEQVPLPLSILALSWTQAVNSFSALLRPPGRREDSNCEEHPNSKSSTFVSPLHQRCHAADRICGTEMKVKLGLQCNVLFKSFLGFLAARHWLSGKGESTLSQRVEGFMERNKTFLFQQ